MEKYRDAGRGAEDTVEAEREPGDQAEPTDAVPPGERGTGGSRSPAEDFIEGMDFLSITRVFDAFFNVSDLAMALVAPDGRLLSSAHWQPICENSFRMNPETRRLCEDSDMRVGAEVARAAAAGSAAPYWYRCGNGLREIAQPLFIEGIHWATLCLGQFLFDDDALDEAALAERARRYGWNEEGFLAAARAVPRYSRKKMEQVLVFCVALGDLASKLNYSAYQERRLAQSAIKAERALSESLEQKDFLFAELQHRVKNSLTLIASLLSISAATVDDELVRSAFDEAQGRIRSVALLYERLYATRSVDSIDLGAYVAEAARSAMEGLSEVDGSIVLETECLPVEFDTRRAIYVGLIVYELVINALKHAFPFGGPGRFRVSLRADGGDLLLAAADDGVGLPDDFSFEARTSLGVLIVRNLARQLGGAVETGRGLPGGPGPGTGITLRFPR